MKKKTKGLRLKSDLVVKIELNLNSYKEKSMAEKKEEKKQENKPLTPSNVISLADNRCNAEGCKSKSKRAGFCNEHFDWFKAGLINKEGKQVVDFDKKYQHFMSAKKAS